MEVKAKFIYLNIAIQITCKENDEMDKMFEQFIKKLNDDSKIEDYICYCDGNKLE